MSLESKLDELIAEQKRTNELLAEESRLAAATFLDVGGCVTALEPAEKITPEQSRQVTETLCKLGLSGASSSSLPGFRQALVSELIELNRQTSAG